MKQKSHYRAVDHKDHMKMLKTVNSDFNFKMWRELGDLHHGLVQESSEVMLISVSGSVPYE
jgi:hypothetical protein